jgi:fructose-bisphosphate aldolase, class II
MNLREVVVRAENEKKAVGHFNISNIEGLHAIFNAAKGLDVPVIIGTSEGERDFIGVSQAVALVQSLREKYNYPIFLNADHTYSIERVEEAARAGYDSVIIDGAKLSYKENVILTKEGVEKAKRINPDILVEAELGYIGTSSKILDEIPEGANTSEDLYTKPEEAKQFVESTGIDLFAPSIGNLHGMLKHAKNPKLSIERIANIREMAGVPLVLHGGSGISDDDFRAAIIAGIGIVHINTEIRLAFRTTLEKELEEKKDEIAPYKFMKRPREAMEEVVKNRLKLFNNL